jgi:hypothetical protein
MGAYVEKDADGENWAKSFFLAKLPGFRDSATL